MVIYSLSRYRYNTNTLVHFSKLYALAKQNFDVNRREWFAPHHRR